jgi:uncharacterized protein YjcR
MTYDESLPQNVTGNGDSAPLPPIEKTAPASATTAALQSGNKGGAPALNRSAERHGAWGFLALGRLPKGASYIRRLMGELRRELEKAVAATHGEVSLPHAALVTTVCRHEGRAMLLSRYLALESEKGDGIKLAERVSILEAIGRATDARDRAIKQLDLSLTVNANPWKRIDRMRQQHALQAATASPNASAATPEAHGGDLP